MENNTTPLEQHPFAVPKPIATNEELISQRLTVFESALKGVKEDSSEYNESLSYRYTRHFFRPALYTDASSGEIDIDVEIVRKAIEYRNSFGLQYATEFLTAAKGLTTQHTLICQIAKARDDAETQNSINYRGDIDRSIFTVPASWKEKKSTRKQTMNFLEQLGVPLPLDRKGVESFEELLNVQNHQNYASNLDDVRKRLFEVLAAAWTIFTPRSLRIAFIYFDFEANVKSSSIEADYYHLSTYGLELILSRLIILRAVNGDEEAREFLKKSEFVWSDSKLDPKEVIWIKLHLNLSLSEEQEKPNIVNLDDCSSSDPIRQAILLSLYVYQRATPKELLSRVSEIYEIDTTVPLLLNWDALYPDIDALRGVSSALMLLTASIVSSAYVRRKHTVIGGQYGLGAAQTDLTNLAIRSASVTKRSSLSIGSGGASLSNFVKEFDTLEAKSKAYTLRFVLQNFDVISGLFASVTKSRDKTIRFLLLKRNFVELIAIRNAIDAEDMNSILSNIRANVRQRTFESDAGSGKLKINDGVLSTQLNSGLIEYRNELLELRKIANPNFRKIRSEIECGLVARKITGFICFAEEVGQTNKVAFDLHLGDKLRHNILSTKFEEALGEFYVKNHVGQELQMEVKDEIETTVSLFNKKWLTISETRSFISELQRLVKAELITWVETDEEIGSLSSKISTKALSHFADLLRECRGQWGTTYLEAAISSLEEIFEDYPDEERLTLDQLLRVVEKSFDETLGWIELNKLTYPKNVNLKELIHTEVRSLKKQAEFLRNFQIRTFEVAQSGKSKESFRNIEVPGSWVEPIVVMVDNLILNACKHSGHGQNTTVKVELRILESKQQLEIVFRNRLRFENYLSIVEKLPALQRRLRHPLDRKRLRNEEGTGLSRIRYAFENEVSKSFRIYIPNLSSKNPSFTVRCIIPAKSLKWEK